MKRSEVLKVTGMASIAAALSNIVVFFGVFVVTREGFFFEAIIGLVFTILFFSTTLLIAIFFQGTEKLKKAVITSYLIRTVLVFIFASLFPFSILNIKVFSVSVAVVAISYGIAQAYLFRKMYRKRRQGQRMTFSTQITL